MKSFSYFVLFSFTNFLLASFDNIILEPTNGEEIRQRVNEKNTFITWRLFIPADHVFESLHIRLFQNGFDGIVAIRNKESKAFKVYENFRNRLRGSKEGIIIEKLDFDRDHESIYRAELSYFKNSSFLYETSSIKLIIIYPPEIKRFLPITPVPENKLGSIFCFIKSFPNVVKVNFIVSNRNIDWESKNVSDEKHIKSIYKEKNDSKLIITVFEFIFQNISRYQSTNLTCLVYDEDGSTTNATTWIDVQYPVDPPSSIQTAIVTNNEALLTWKQPNLESGNPKQILIYIVEFKKSDPFKYSDLLGEISKESGFEAHENAIDGNSDVIQDMPWQELNTTKTNLQLVDLEPNSHYDVRVRSHNGADISQPSHTITFKTSAKYSSPPNSFFTQSQIVAIVVSVTLISMIITFFTVTYILEVRKRKTRRWAVLNSTKGNNENNDQGPFKSDHKDLENESFEFNTAFANLPLPQFDQNILANHNVESSDKTSVVSNKTNHTLPQDSRSLKSLKPQNTTQASKYIAPAMSSGNLSLRSRATTPQSANISLASLVSGKSEYV